MGASNRAMLTIRLVANAEDFLCRAQGRLRSATCTLQPHAHLGLIKLHSQIAKTHITQYTAISTVMRKQKEANRFIATKATLLHVA